MRSVIYMADFLIPDTGKTDWTAYRAACLEGGQTCTQCGALIYPRTGHRCVCSDCKNLEKPEEANHDSRLRCPACGESWNPAECDDPTTAYADGEHDVTCPECSHEFEITTHVSYSYTSPARIQQEPEPAAEEPDDGAWACGPGGPDC